MHYRDLDDVELRLSEARDGRFDIAGPRDGVDRLLTALTPEPRALTAAVEAATALLAAAVEAA